MREYTVEPKAAGIGRAPLAALAGGDDVAANAAVLRCVLGLDGERAEMGPRQDVVLLNAAAVLMAAGLASDVRGGVELAEQALTSGAVQGLVDGLRRG